MGVSTSKSPELPLESVVVDLDSAARGSSHGTPPSGPFPLSPLRTSTAAAAFSSSGEQSNTVKLEAWLPAPEKEDKEDWFREHLLKPRHDEREVFPRTSTWRTLTALTGSPFGARVPFHVSNLGTELQAEKSIDSWVWLCDEIDLRKLHHDGPHVTGKGVIGKVHSGSRVRFGKEGASSEGGGWLEKTATELLEKAIASAKDSKDKVVHPDTSKVRVNATTDDWGDPYVGMGKVLQQKTGNSGRPDDWTHLCNEGDSAEVAGHTLLRFGVAVENAPGYWTKERYAAPHVQLTESIIRHGFELPSKDPFGKGGDPADNPRVLEHREDHLDEVDKERADVMYQPFLQFALDMLTDLSFPSPGGCKWSQSQFKQYVLVLKAAMMDNPGKPLLLSKVRGPAGESIYLWAVLMEQFELAEWLLQLEPMLFKTRYWGPEYRGENALHILCSKKKLKELRGLAQTVLFYEPPDHPDFSASLPRENQNLWSLADKVKRLEPPPLPGASRPASPIIPGRGAPKTGGASPTPAQTFSTLSQFKEQLGLQTSVPKFCDETLLKNSTSLLCLLSWKLMFHHWEPIDDKGKTEKKRIADDPKMALDSSKALCGDWMRAAWTRHVNGLAYGSFFEPAELGGTCYYGGTPVAIATVMGDVDTVRFLCMEVGCTDKASWEACSPSKDGAAGYKHLYPDSLDPDFTKDGDPKSHRFASSLLKSWDHRRCARLDCADRFGNTAAHMAVSAHPTTDMYAYLQSLYLDGYGRCALYYFKEERDMVEAAQKLAPPPPPSGLLLVVTPLSEGSALCSDGSGCEELVKALLAEVEKTLDKAWVFVDPDPFPVAGDGGGGGGDAPGGGGGGSPRPASPLASKYFRKSGSLHGEIRLRIPLVRSAHLPSPATDETVKKLAETLERHYFPSAGADAHTSLSPPKPITVTFSKDGVETSETLHLGLTLGGHASVAAAVRCALAGSCTTACTKKINSCTSVLCPRENLVNSCDCEPMVNEINLAAGDDEGQTTFAGWRRPTKFPVGVAKATAKRPNPSDAYTGDNPSQQSSRTLTASSRTLAVAVAAAAAAPTSTAAQCTAAALLPKDLKDIVNREGLTPLTLAVRRGKRDMFEDLWKLSRSTEWQWGAVTCSTLSLDQVDDIAQVMDEKGVSDWAKVRKRSAVEAENQARKFEDQRGTARCLACACCCRYGWSPLKMLGQLWAWALAVLWWWLPLPSPRHFRCRDRQKGLKPVPPPAMFVAVKYSINELLDATLTGAGTSEATVSRAVLAGAIAGPEARAALHRGVKNSPDLAGVFNDYHAEASQLIDLARAPTSTEEVPLLQLLAQRKWDRMYQLRFWKLAIVRGASLVAVWAILLARYAVADDTPEAVRLSGTVLVGAGVVFAVHLLRELLFRQLYWAERCCRRVGDPGKHASKRLAEYRDALKVAANGALAEDVQKARDAAKKAAIKAAVEDPPPRCAVRCSTREKIGEASPTGLAPREVQLYASAHGGVFGNLYLATLLLGSGLLAAGAAIDWSGGLGWAYAGPFYAFGGFCSALPRVVFVLGGEGAGPHSVMFSSLVWAEFFKWLGLFIPTLVAYAFFFQLMSASVNAEAGGAGVNVESFFRDFFLFSFDVSLNSQPTNNAYTLGNPTAANPKTNHTLLLIVYVFFLFFSTVALISLLIGQMSFVLNNAFTRKSDFLLERLRAMHLLDSMTTRAKDRFPDLLEDRYWVLPAKADERPSFHWLAHKKAPWINEHGKNLARDATRRPYQRHLAPAFARVDETRGGGAFHAFHGGPETPTARPY